MREMFSSDSKLMKALSKLFDIGYLSIVFILFSLPVVTIGASLTALYYTTVKVIRRDRGYVFHEFLHSFKTNFWAATKLWIVELVLMLLLAYNLYVVEGFVTGIYLAMAILVIAMYCYAYPILSRFVLNNTKIVKMSIILMIKHLYFTIPMVVIVVGSAVLLVLLVPFMPIVPLLVPGLSSLIYSFMMEWIMKKYMPKTEDNKNEDGEAIDAWYNE
ncbi:MAG: DUF624 domain-containing protein [Lachnospiraceae bacterium]|nr:DUF624 domain-containing protein [Lachnospiraceae bacterium]